MAADAGGVFAGVRDLDLGAAAACFVFGVDTTIACASWVMIAKVNAPARK